VATIPGMHTFAVGEVLTAATLNTYLRDAVNFVLKKRPMMRCAQTSGGGTSLANTTWTNIGNMVVIVDSDSGLNTSTGTYTVPNAGWYIVTGGVVYNPNTTGDRAVRLTVNGNAQIGIASSGAGPDRTAPILSRLLYLAAGATVNVQGWQSSGGALGTVVDAIESSSLECFFFSQ